MDTRLNPFDSRVIRRRWPRSVQLARRQRSWYPTTGVNSRTRSWRAGARWAVLLPVARTLRGLRPVPARFFRP
jgi:hypothetical protein